MKSYASRSAVSLLIALCFLMLFSSCKKNDPNGVVKGETKVKMVNAAITEVPQNIYADNVMVSLAPIAFSETTDYIKLASGSRVLRFSGDNGMQTERTMAYTPAITYTTFLIADRQGIRDLLSFEDNLSNTESGKAKIKLINLTPYFATGINVSVQAGTQFVNGLAYKQASAYFAVEPGINLRYNVVGGGNAKTLDGTAMEAGKIYTIWFSGTTAATLEAHIITDN
ncbi:DUF4397 domain-containing protein [Pedobacter sandarakinus]|uniref:DUF4397 domain-containing protein n=1 Tax=Pedobacter sandarakinus TaxID=353156 RepID=UPI00224737F7|nr:DUF4397 domain-containing protein [Pedobacter sandarakinus]MCX2575498.1 DUF4397 domain-containing protein [Pedobacter sandarakinus]